MTWVDLVIVALLAAAVYAAVRRGLLFSVVDTGRAVVGVVLGVAAYALMLRWTSDYVAGACAFYVMALLSFTLLGLLARKLFVDSDVSKKVPGRIGAGFVGLGLGLAICLFVVPVFGNVPALAPAVQASRLAQPFLDAMPVLSSVADGLSLDLPQLSRQPTDFHREGTVTSGRPARRVNFTRLAGATCYECRNGVGFEGYFRTGLAQVSPRLRCPNCGRTSDGCQTFEGFHQMYGACPVQVATDDQAELDCGVWPNDKPVLPVGACTVCRLEGAW
jgi:hypothetical protein